LEDSTRREFRDRLRDGRRRALFHAKSDGTRDSPDDASARTSSEATIEAMMEDVETALAVAHERNGKDHGEGEIGDS
jgi:hypothetical protein